jgi:hypothetical protein
MGLNSAHDVVWKDWSSLLNYYSSENFPLYVFFLKLLQALSLEFFKWSWFLKLCCSFPFKFEYSSWGQQLLVDFRVVNLPSCLRLVGVLAQTQVRISKNPCPDFDQSMLSSKSVQG